MITCLQGSSVNVAAATCGASTDWLANPGKCRLRIKSYAPTLFDPSGCGACLNLATRPWDGTFSNLLLNPSPDVAVAYTIDGTAFDSINGKEIFVSPVACAVFYWTAAGPTGWNVVLACITNIGSSNIYTTSPLLLGGPLQTFIRTGGCSPGPANVVIEAYSL